MRVDIATDHGGFGLKKALVAELRERGIAICGSGVGASVCANKVPGIRATLIHDHFSARQGVEDDHMNVRCMRHVRRLDKVAALEGERGGRR